MSFSHGELQKAIYTKLSGDATLMALVTGVYDHVPQHTPTPYITIGELSAVDISNVATAGMRYTAVVRAYSTDGGRKQAGNVLSRAFTLLHRANLTLSGFSLVSLRYLSSDIVLQDDGLTYVGILRLRAEVMG